MGCAVPLESSALEVVERTIGKDEIGAEVERFRLAVLEARRDLELLRKTTADTLGEENAAIFDVHLSILSDPMGYDDTVRDICAEKRNAEYIYRRNLSRVAESLEKQGDPFFGERAQDIRDVKRRVIRHLLNADTLRTAEGNPGVLVAHEIIPSEAAMLDPTRVLGLAVDVGGRTSHAAIMARSRGIPAVVGLKHLSTEVRAGDIVILDGLRGWVVVNPRPDTFEAYRRRQARHQEAERRCAAVAGLPAVTLDGRAITLAANMEMPEETDLVLRRGATGVGLFRTEFFFMRQHRFPTEDEQYVAYRAVAEKMAPHPVIIRTLDVGGDKFSSYLGTSREDNPFLGMRGIRFLGEQRDLFRTQLRAAYRASAHGRVKILLPMVSGLEELRAARHLCAEVTAELRGGGVPFDPAVELGVMVEVPSAVILSDVMAREAEFFSIGSNDLIQYTLAVDRASTRVAHLYQPFHPAVLRSIRRTVEAAHRVGRWVGICGEMAGDPTATVLLVGLGLDELSVGAFLLPEVKQVIRGVRYADAAAWAAQAVAMTTAAEVQSLMRPIMERLFPGAAGETDGSPAAGPDGPAP